VIAVICHCVGQERVSVAVTCCQMVQGLTWGSLLDPLWLLVTARWSYDTRAEMSAIFALKRNFITALRLCSTVPYSRCLFSTSGKSLTLVKDGFVGIFICLTRVIHM